MEYKDTRDDEIKMLKVALEKAEAQVVMWKRRAEASNDLHLKEVDHSTALKAALEKAEARANVLDDHYKFQEQHRLEAVTKLEAANCKIEEMRDVIILHHTWQGLNEEQGAYSESDLCDKTCAVLSNLPSSVGMKDVNQGIYGES